MDLTNVTITTKRLQLVPLSENYAEDLFREFTVEITAFMYPRSPEKIEDTLEYINTALPKLQEGKELPLIILDKYTGEFLGGTGIHEIDTKTPRFGIWVKKSAHGNKYGQETIKALKKWANEHLSYNYLIYDVDKQNIPSRKVAESLGGIMGNEYRKKNMSGEIMDMVEYRIYR